MFHELLKVSRA
jgi:hypothetical protein